MRIGIYVGDFPPEEGGAYTFVTDILGSFLQIAGTSEHSFVVMCDPSSVHAVRQQIVSQNVSVVPVGKPRLLGKSVARLKWFSPLFRWLWRRAGPVERVAQHQELQLLWFVGVGAYECPNMPYIATVWDLQHRYQPFFPEVSAKGGWDRREQFFSYFLRRAAYCLTGTETGKREIQHLYQLAEPRVRVFPLPTPKFVLQAPQSTLDIRSRFGIVNDYIFYPAQFWPHKNHANLILAVKWLRLHRGLDIALALTGADKGNLDYIKHFAEKEGVADRVHFLGFVSTEELIALYRQAKALTFVTYFGPDNIPPLEAFALGCPVIASAVEGAKEQYGDAVLHVHASSPEDIGKAVWQLHSDVALRATLVEAGFTAAEKWTSVDYLKGIFKLFDEFSAVRRNWV